MAATIPQVFDYLYELKEADICNRALARIGSAAIRDTVDQSKQAITCRAVYSATRDELLRQYPWNFACRTDYVLRDANYPYVLSEGRYAYFADDRYAITSGNTAVGTGYVVIPNITNPLPADLSGRLIGRRITGTNVRPNTTITAYNAVTGTLTIDRGTATYAAGVYTPAAGSNFSYYIPVLKILEIDHDPNAQYTTEGGDSEKRIVTTRITGTTTVNAVSYYYLSVKYIRQVINPDQFDQVFTDALVLRIASKIAMTMTRQSGIVKDIENEFAVVMRDAKFTASEERNVDEDGEWATDRMVGGGPSTRTI